MKRIVCVIGLACLLCGCEQQTSDVQQRKETTKSLAEAHKQVGMPDITRWTERKLARDILELRDQEITTFAYIVNMHGDLIYLGEAIGFGLPYSVQFTNPEKFLHEGGSRKLPQADPNGLFMPDGLSATWIMLKGPDGEIHPVYVEPQIIVSPFKLTLTKL